MKFRTQKSTGNWHRQSCAKWNDLDVTCHVLVGRVGHRCLGLGEPGWDSWGQRCEVEGDKFTGM